MTRTRDMAALPLAIRADIEDLQFGAGIFQFVYAHLRNLRKRITGVVPCFHSTDEIACEFGEAGANKQAHDFIKIIILLQHEQDRLFGIEQ